MKEHLQKAHQLWEKHLQPTDAAIDATCGNGYDAEVLSNLLPQGQLFCFDIQSEALKKSKTKLGHNSPVQWIHACHSLIDTKIPLQLLNSYPLRLIVYNLGYLPGGDKNMTTQTETTLLSLKKALILTSPYKGALSIMCYPGHPEGVEETRAVRKWALNSRALPNLVVEQYTWEHTSAQLLWIYRK